MCIAGNVVVLARLRPDIVKLQDSMETPCCPIFLFGDVEMVAFRAVLLDK